MVKMQGEAKRCWVFNFCKLQGRDCNLALISLNAHIESVRCSLQGLFGQEFQR